jgi:hypothetical protein
VGKRRKNLQAGIALEHYLSEELHRLNVPNTLTRGNEENIGERVDLKVPAPQFSGQPDFEFQLTLKQGIQRKMREFVLAALLNPQRGVRIYLEIAASRFNDLRHIARRVACAIKDIVHRWQRFEPYDIQGVRVRVGRPKQPTVERFSLLDRVGDWVFNAFNAYRAKQRQLEEEAKERRKRQLENHLRFLENLRHRHTSRHPSPDCWAPPNGSMRQTVLGKREPRMYVPIRQP